MKHELAQRVFRNILAEAGRQDISRGELIEAMGINESSYYRRFERPDLIRMREIEGAAELLGIKPESLVWRGPST